jgi:hypothetical protein
MESTTIIAICIPIVLLLWILSIIIIARLVEFRISINQIKRKKKKKDQEIREFYNTWHSIVYSPEAIAERERMKRDGEPWSNVPLFLQNPLSKDSSVELDTSGK